MRFLTLCKVADSDLKQDLRCFSQKQLGDIERETIEKSMEVYCKWMQDYNLDLSQLIADETNLFWNSNVTFLSFL